MAAVMMPLLSVLACSALAVAQVSIPDDHPVRFDRTGIKWHIPFENARQAAADSGRLLAIKPVAFGTTANGCW